jgi:hypothetical protein
VISIATKAIGAVLSSVAATPPSRERRFAVAEELLQLKAKEPAE